MRVQVGHEGVHVRVRVVDAHQERQRLLRAQDQRGLHDHQRAALEMREAIKTHDAVARLLEVEGLDVLLLVLRHQLGDVRLLGRHEALHDLHGGLHDAVHLL